jgi:hypothetical protein
MGRIQRNTADSSEAGQLAELLTAAIYPILAISY